MKKPNKVQVLAGVKRLLCLLGGNIGYALALDLFLVGNKIAAGGLSGVGIVINHFVAVPIGVFMFILTIPLLVWAFFVKDTKYVLLTLVSAVTYSAATDLLAKLPTLTDNLIIASVCGGIVYGAAAALLLKADCSSGGTDLLSKLLLTKFKNTSLGKMYMIVDGTIVAAAMIVFKSFESGFYAILTLGVCAYVTDAIVHGMNKASIFYIITNGDPGQLARLIMDKLNRGVTCQHGTGMYANTQREILMVVVKPRQVYKLKDLVKAYDPTAFMMLVSASEVLGKGFSDMDVNKIEKNELVEFIKKKSEKGS